MNEPRDGGPAFPCPVMDFQPETGNQVVREQYYGITVRDYFAGMAMSGIERQVDRSGLPPELKEFARQSPACWNDGPKH